ncbi:MAG: sugar transferase [Bacteroidetes bacterium]|nr:sugar transferase [Bacteroidota bacterium]
MSRRTELIFLVLVDALATFVANGLWYRARFEWGWFAEPVYVPDQTMLLPMLGLLSLFWLVVFTFFGLYRERYAASRFDELVTIVKVVSVGILALFFLLFIELLDAYSARSNVVFYWAAVIVCVSVGRILVRSIQKMLILRGKGLHRALIVGWGDVLDALHEEVARYPEAGLDIVGGVRLRRDSEMPASDDNGHHRVEDLPRLIDELHVQDVLIALGPNDGEHLMEVLRLCDGKPVTLKLVPDFYSIIGGMARTEHMYGLPLIEVLPEPMQAWEQSLKRLIDLVVSFLVVVIGLPVWIFLALVIRLTSSGPAIYRQRRIGQKGREFTMYKFRTMREDAEAETGPVWATEDDPRYTAVGRWLRKTRLDEVPQFFNVLRGDMSLVGPRPERPFFVEKLAREIPLYSRRHRVKPGITGWAQVKWKYDTSLEDVQQKVKYDLFYIENMSLRRDLQILFRTIYTALRGSGH